MNDKNLGNGDEGQGDLTPPEGVLMSIEGLLKEIINRLNVLPEVLAEEVASSIVGQSYYNYDKSFTYFPTLVMVFREVGAFQYPRRSQVKGRLKVDNKSISDVVVQNMRKSAIALRGFTYQYGTLRGNYVSQDKRWKTTVFASSRPEGLSLLNTLCNMVDERFNEKNISWTEGRERLNPFRREESLDDIPITPPLGIQNPTMKLHRVVLLVNGVSKPILLMRD